MRVLDTKKKYKIGSFLITCLPVTHNVINYAFLIEHEEFGKLAFCTDAVGFQYKIQGLNHLLIEANYDENIVLDHLCENQEIRSNNQYHMEIGNTIKAIEKNVSSSLNTIILCHLSDGQSNEKDFQQRVFNAVGIFPKIAAKHLEVELSKEEF